MSRNLTEFLKQGLWGMGFAGEMAIKFAILLALIPLKTLIYLGILTPLFILFNPGLTLTSFGISILVCAVSVSLNAASNWVINEFLGFAHYCGG